MKREFLQDFGLDKDAIDKIMAENGRDIEAQKTIIGSKETELNTANKTIKDLQDTVKKFDGVDIVKLKKDVTDWENKYNADISAAKLHSALDMALISAKAKNPKLAKAALDIDKIKLDGDKLLGLEDQLTKLKETDAYLFDANDIGKDTPPPTRVDSGKPHQDPPNTSATTLLGALQEKYK